MSCVLRAAICAESRLRRSTTWALRVVKALRMRKLSRGEFIDYMLSHIPRGRFLEVEEAASMVAWLVSKENSFTTASVFDLSGGRATY
jgi:NAD(P)-dependent dehydrogenase (short-subunit alcohol dehydrogenase family)